MQDSGLAAESFDQILCLEVIEHIQDDRAVVRELAALLKPNGTLMISTPYLHYRGMEGDRISAVEDGGHVRWGYDLAQLRELAAQAGLQVARVDYLSGFVSQRLTNALRILGRWNSLLAWAAILPLRVLGFVDMPLTKLLNYPHGSIAIVAVKPEQGNRL